jgi:hypothetical protein
LQTALKHEWILKSAWLFFMPIRRKRLSARGPFLRCEGYNGIFRGNIDMYFAWLYSCKTLTTLFPEMFDHSRPFTTPQTIEDDLPEKPTA